MWNDDTPSGVRRGDRRDGAPLPPLSSLLVERDRVRFVVVAPVTALEHALRYAELGYRVAPIPNGTKYPGRDDWQEVATTDPDMIRSWWSGSWRSGDDPDTYGVCIVTGVNSGPGSNGVFVVDIDPKHQGDEFWADLEHEHGAAPETMECLTGGGGRHLFFNLPDGVVIRNDQSGRVAPGVDIRGEGGQVVAPPTIHPDTGLNYEWDALNDPTDGATPVDAPQWLIDLLTAEPERREPRRRQTGATSLSDRPGDRFEAETDWADLLTADGWTLHSIRNGRDGYYEMWTRPGKDVGDGASASLYYKGGDVLKNFSPNAPGLKAEATYTRFGYYAATKHNGDHGAAAAALATKYETRPDIASPTAGIDVDELFDASPVLRHIRDAARARRVGPMAALGGVLARVAAFTPASTCIPPFIGQHVPLNLFVAISAQTGAGKSSAAAVARNLLPLDLPGVIGPVPLGSGEGVVDAFMEPVSETVDGKRRTRKKVTQHGALFDLDEGRVLGDMAGRKGATIIPTLCSAWVGADLGQANASVDTWRHLPAGAYSIGLVSSWQPKLMAPLFDDEAGGLPGRFLFVPVIDTSAPEARPDWPGALTWTPPAIIRHDPDAVVMTPNPLELPDAVVRLVDDERLAIVRGDRVPAPLDAHRTLLTLKVAGLLAVLDGVDVVTLDHWDIARRIVDVSTRTRDEARHALDAVQTEQREAAIRTAVRRDEAVQTNAETRSLQRAASAIARKANRTGACTRRDAARAIAGRDREFVSVDDAVDHAVTLDFITVDPDGTIRPGRSVPA